MNGTGNPRPCLVVLCLCLLCGCGADAPNPAPPSASNTDGTPGKTDTGRQSPPAVDSRPRVLVLEIEEENTDTFPSRLAEDDEDLPEPPFQILYGQLVIHRERPTVHPLDQDALTLDASGTPLSKCTIFVIDTVRFNGRGRIGTGSRYYAFAALPAQIPMRAGAVRDKYELDPGKTPVAQAVHDIRLLPTGVNQITLGSAAGGKVTVAMDGVSKTVLPGEAAELSALSKAIEVSVRALTSESVTTSDDVFDDAPPAAAGAVRVLIEPVSYGKVRFETKVTVKFHGLFPLTTTPPQPHLED